VINLTNTPEIREEGPRWSPDGKTVALNHKPKDATVYNIALMDWATRKVTLLTHERTPNHLWQSAAWSPDGRPCTPTAWKSALPTRTFTRLIF
jgi:Tol biopolymer transport system component